MATMGWIAGRLKVHGQDIWRVFQCFIEKEYFQINRAVQTEIQKNEFQSLYDVNVGNADEATQKKRASIIEAAQPSDSSTLEQRLAEKWEQTINLMPPGVKNMLPSPAAEQFRQDEYYTVLEDVVEERQNEHHKMQISETLKANIALLYPRLSVHSMMLISAERMLILKRVGVSL